MKCLCKHDDSEHKIKINGEFGGCRVRKCGCRKFQCGHWRVKKNYPYGKKSRAMKVCRDCREIVTNKFIEKRRIENKNL